MTKFNGSSLNTSNKERNANNKTKSNDSKKSNTNKSPINPERLVFKGTKMTIDGKEMWWCKFHKCPRGTYDRMYVMHPPEKHDEW